MAADNKGDFLVGLLVGSALGAALALLYAPQSGEETRETIKRKGLDIKDSATDVYDQVKEQTTTIASQVKESATNLAGTVKDSASTVASRVGETVSRVKGDVTEGVADTTETIAAESSVVKEVARDEAAKVDESTNGTTL